MKRKIIAIEHSKCNGCGACVPDCPEGAIQIIDGKAHLVSDLFCDGLGACIGACPTGAMRIEEREAEPYDERRVMENVVTHGENVIRAHLSHLKSHGEEKYLSEALLFLKEKGIAVPQQEMHHHTGGCSGSMMRDMRSKPTSVKTDAGNNPGVSELRQWPVQLSLVNPAAPYFDTEELLVTADCVPFAYGNYHARFLKGKPVVIFCPKLDGDSERYIQKLSSIIAAHPISRIGVVRMEVPCCGGSTKIVEEAVRLSGKNVVIREYVISIDGEIV
ncbi:MAG TPA: 4Fe-4S binding protein [Spirochaetota bacterium]